MTRFRAVYLATLDGIAGAALLTLLMLADQTTAQPTLDPWNTSRYPHSRIPATEGATP